MYDKKVGLGCLVCLFSHADLNVQFFSHVLILFGMIVKVLFKKMCCHIRFAIYLLKLSKKTVLTSETLGVYVRGHHYVNVLPYSLLLFLTKTLK